MILSVRPIPISFTAKGLHATSLHFIYCILRSHCPIFLKYLPCFHLVQIRPQKFRNELRAAEKAGRIKHYNHTTNVLSLPASCTIYDCMIDGMKFILLSPTKHQPRNHKQNRKLKAFYLRREMPSYIKVKRRGHKLGYD